jgi:hypothetical protein
MGCNACYYSIVVGFGGLLVAIGYYLPFKLIKGLQWVIMGYCGGICGCYCYCISGEGWFVLLLVSWWCMGGEIFFLDCRGLLFGRK